VLFLAATNVVFTAVSALALQLLHPQRSDPVVADAEALRKYKAVRTLQLLLVLLARAASVGAAW
jgi:hypothetical protein